jgi:hypothetical protein
MSDIQSGIHSAFEKDFKTRFVPLSKRLSKIENRIQKVMFEAIRNNRISFSYWSRVRRELTLLYAKMNRIFSSWSKEQIPIIYRKSLRQIDARIRVARSVINTGKRGLTATLNSRASAQIMQSLYRSASEGFLDASLLGRKNMFNLTRLTQQTLIQESLIDVTVAQGLELGNLRTSANAITGQLWEKLWNEAENKQFVQAGKMKFKPDTYAELVARTKFHEAQSQAALLEASNYDTDLIQVSSHNTTTEICIPFEGKIFSISGKDKRFPPLTESSPFHPRCLHLMYPAFESALETQGTLESFSAFSKGKISRPPAPASFIPVGNRELV